MATFKERGDNHIMSLELLAIAFGLSVFGERLRGMNLELYSDNTGAERATAKGGSREWDHSCIAHCIWFVISTYVVFSYVPSQLQVEGIAVANGALGFTSPKQRQHFRRPVEVVYWTHHGS